MKQATEKMIKVTADAGAEYIKGKLVLIKAEDQDIIDCTLWKTKKGEMFFNDIDSFHFLLDNKATPWLPFIVSEAEKIMEGDKCLHVHSKAIFTADAACLLGDGTIMGDKILILPYSFTLEAIRFIITHKIKDGDRVLIKVDEFLHTTPSTFYVQEPLALVSPIKDWEKEFEKCKSSPYYFATNYYTVNGKPFTTRLNEKEFNEQVNKLQKS